MADCRASDRRDLACDRRAGLLLWRLPTAALIAGLLLRDSKLKTAIWMGSLTQMGIACLANAARCGRLHCYFTGPFFLLGALASLLRGVGAIQLSWRSLGLSILLGVLILWRLPEMLWGKYTSRAG